MIYNVMVVGAGMSGLAAAKHLTSKGIKVGLLEARHRLGGRILPVPVENASPIELGAQFLYGRGTQDNLNPLIPLFERFGIKSLPIDPYNADAFDTEGQPCDLNSIISSIKDPLEKAIQTIQHAKIKKNGPFPSLATLLHYHKNTIPPNNSLAFWTRHCITATLKHHTGAELEDLSMLELMSEDSYEGPVEIVLGGYQKLIDGLYNDCKVTHNLTLHLNKIVKDIHFLAAEKLFKITTHDRKSYKTEAVLCTVPLGTLKHSAIRFVPTLSVEKQKALRNLNVGFQNTIVLEFEHAFWPTTVHALYPNDPDINVWPEYINLNAFTQNNKAILLANVYGDAAKFSKKTDPQLIDVALSPLYRAYKNKVKKPIHAWVSRWDSDPFCRGSRVYCGLQCGKEDLDAFTQTEHGGGLYFAGDYTRAHDHGTLTGAYGSGIEAALNIEVFLNNKERLGLPARVKP